ncbi:MAG: Bug family tripartite tricarboxylate transporter substrate binding protein [Lautropia sp.]
MHEISRCFAARLRRRHALAAAAAVALSLAGPAAAQQSAGPIRIVVGFAAGNAADSLARTLAERLAAELSTPVIVENKPGAGSRIAIQSVKHAAPDGRTMLIATSSAMFLNPLVFKNLPYDSEKDFAPVANIGNNQIAMTVAANAPYRTLKEFAAWLKANPAKAEFGNEGVGSPGHLLGLHLGVVAGVPMTFVPYRATSQLITDQIGNQITAATWALPSVYEAHKSGQLRIIGIAAPKRSTVAPDLPTFKEQGFDIEIISSYGVYFPAGTPGPVVDQMSSALVKIIREPAVQARLRQLGVDPTGLSATEFQQAIVDDRRRWARMVRDTDFKVD